MCVLFERCIVTVEVRMCESCRRRRYCHSMCVCVLAECECLSEASVFVPLCICLSPCVLVSLSFHPVY